MPTSFLILNKNTCCGYSLEAPRWGTSNEYPQHMFLSRNKKNITWIPPLICSYALRTELSGHHCNAYCSRKGQKVMYNNSYSLWVKFSAGDILKPFFIWWYIWECFLSAFSWKHMLWVFSVDAIQMGTYNSMPLLSHFILFYFILCYLNLSLTWCVEKNKIKKKKNKKKKRNKIKITWCIEKNITKKQ